MKIKRTFSLWAFFFGVVIFFSSCGDDVINQNIINPGAEQRAFSVSPSEIQMLAQEGSIVQFTIETDYEWKIQGVPDWLQLSAISGKEDATIVVTALSANKSNEERIAILVVVSNGKKEVVTISQQKMAMSPIIGEWKYSWDDDYGYGLLTLRADGTGIYYEREGSEETGDIDEYEESCFYQYDEDADQLTLWWVDGGELGDKEIVHLEWINANAFIADHLMDSQSLWIRQK